MKILKNAKIFLSVVITFGIIMMASQVFAADDNYQGILDLNAKSNTANNSVNNSINNSINNSAVLTTNNTTKYNNTALPDTGIEDAMPVTLLLIVFGISAVYAYKKVKDYRKI